MESSAGAQPRCESAAQIGEMFFHGLDFGLEFGQVGLEFGNLFGLGLEPAPEVAAVSACPPVAHMRKVGAAPPGKVMSHWVVTLIHGLAPYHFQGIGFRRVLYEGNHSTDMSVEYKNPQHEPLLRPIG